MLLCGKCCQKKGRKRKKVPEWSETANYSAKRKKKERKKFLRVLSTIFLFDLLEMAGGKEGKFSLSTKDDDYDEGGKSYGFPYFFPYFFSSM